MLLADPMRTPYDWNFRLFGFPVRVSPWFWLGSLLLTGGGGRSGGVGILVCILATFLSILIHELGHAFAFRYFGKAARIVLYQFGGIAIADQDISWGGARALRDPRSGIVISVAGPALQMACGLFLFAFIGAWGFRMAPPLSIMDRWFPSGNRFLPSQELDLFVQVFCWISVNWALLNLLPVFPLDGGQIARNLFLMFGGYQAIRNSIVVSLITAGVVALWAFQHDSRYMGIMFMMLAYSSYQLLQQTRY